MFIQRKPYLRNIKRVRVAEGRNLDKGLRLDRNEKVDLWPKNFLTGIFAERPDYLLSVYPDINALYEKIARHLHVDVNQVVLTSGIDGGIKTIFDIMTFPGDIVGVLSPTYAMYKVYSDLFQTCLFEIGYLPDFRLNQNQLDSFLALKPSVLFLPNPNQPIESALTLRELESLANRTYEQNCLLFIDEAYHMFGCDTGISLIRDHENVVVARTFSKAFGVPSIRLGFMVSTLDNMDVLSKTRFAHESNSLSNTVAEYLLDHYDLVLDYIKKVVLGREIVRESLGVMGIKVHGSKGNFLLIDLQSPEAARNIVAFLRENLIYVKGPWSPPWDRYITITAGPPSEMKRFLDALVVAKEKYFV